MSFRIKQDATPPLPTPFEWDRGFWDAAREKRLVVQRCTACQTIRSFPRLMCSRCHAMDFDWVESAGTGTIYSATTLSQPFHPAFAEKPVTVGIVALDDFPQVHLVSLLRAADGSPVEAPPIGTPVRVHFEDMNEEITLPRFRLLPQ